MAIQNFCRCFPAHLRIFLGEIKIMLRSVALPIVALSICGIVSAAEMQGVLTDWNCTQRMVKDGREKVLKQDSSCSLVQNPTRKAYGLITDEKKFYQLDARGTHLAQELLSNSHDKDNLRVVTSGEIQGNLIKVGTMSIL
jgi:hypothetical protein